jgi:hypothetical protein
MNPEALVDQIRNDPAAKLPFDEAKAAIIQQLNGRNDDGVETDLVSLLDPVGLFFSLSSVIPPHLKATRKRIAIPVRGSDCTHLQCFDLASLLARKQAHKNVVSKRRYFWDCPVASCRANAFHTKLIIDGSVLLTPISVCP